MNLSQIESDVSGVVTKLQTVGVPLLQETAPIIELLFPAQAVAIKEVLAGITAIQTVAPNLSANVSAAKSALAPLEADLAAIAAAVQATKAL